MKRFIFIAFLVFLLGGAGTAYFLFRSVGAGGSTTVEQWIGSQLQTIANSYINPQLSFTDLDYTYPGTVSLKDLKLIADDPANPGKKIEIIGCGQATITLAEIPEIGKPIVIERISLDKPLFSAVSVRPAANEFVGFSNLMRGGMAAATQPVDVQTPTKKVRAKLSDFFQMRLVELKDGRLIYDPRIPGTEPMSLDQINTALKVEPAEAGTYMLSVSLARKPVFEFSVAGMINLDTFHARDAAMRIIANIGQDKLDYLPPQLQQLIRKHDIRGALNILVYGDLPLLNPFKGTGDAEVKLTNANITIDEYKIPVDDLSLNAGFEDGELTLNMLRIAALKGVMTISGSAKMNELIDADLQIGIKDMLLQELLATRQAGKQPKLAGKINASIEAAAPLMVVLAKATPPTTQPLDYMKYASEKLPDKWGSASLSMVDGRLVEIPAIQKLTGAIRGAAKLVSIKTLDEEPPAEQADIKLDLTGDHATFTEINYIGEVVAARGKGTVWLNQKLDLLVNAGPIEKLQSMLGRNIGAMLGSVTDKLLAYKVVGTMEDPKVEPLVAGGTVGGIANTAKNTVETGVNAVGEGVKGIGEGIGNLFKRGR